MSELHCSKGRIQPTLRGHKSRVVRPRLLDKKETVKEQLEPVRKEPIRMDKIPSDFKSESYTAFHFDTKKCTELPPMYNSTAEFPA